MLKTTLPIEFSPRKSAVLSVSSLACLADVASINLTSSCAHRCVYCYSRGYSSCPPAGTVVVYSNLLEKLKTEWVRKRKKPKTVYFSPSSDLFQPIPEVLQIGYEILDFLLKQNLNIAFVTKGVIPDLHFDLFQKYPTQIQAQIGLISADNSLLSLLEPNAASAETRLEQMRKLSQAGISTTARLDPIIPSVTDDDAAFQQICKSVSAAGIQTIAASVLFLRPAIQESLLRNISNPEILDRIMSRFARSKRLAIHAGSSVVSALGREERASIFTRLHTIAQAHNLAVHICGCKNPDIPPEWFSKDCRLAGLFDADPVNVCLAHLPTER